jgi:hypothetical protein
MSRARRDAHRAWADDRGVGPLEVRLVGLYCLNPGPTHVSRVHYDKIRINRLSGRTGLAPMRRAYYRKSRGWR